MIRKRKEIFWGVVLIIVALGTLGIAFNLIETTSSILIWSILLGAVALGNLVTLSWFGVFFPLAVVAHINAASLQIANIWPVYLAALFLSIGASKLTRIFRKKNGRRFKMNINGDTIDIDTDKIKESVHFSSSSQTIEGDNIEIENNFGDAARYINSANLVHANIENNFGHFRVYFDQATFSHRATIYVENNFGKTTLYIPRNVNINNHLKAAFGVVQGEDYTTSDPNLPTVTITGEAAFGSIQIVII